MNCDVRVMASCYNLLLVIEICPAASGVSTCRSQESRFVLAAIHGCTKFTFAVLGGGELGSEPKLGK